MPATVKSDNKPRACIIKTHYIVADRFLPLKPNGVVTKKLIPELTLPQGHVLSQHSGERNVTLCYMISNSLLPSRLCARRSRSPWRDTPRAEAFRPRVPYHLPRQREAIMLRVAKFRYQAASGSEFPCKKINIFAMLADKLRFKGCAAACRQAALRKTCRIPCRTRCPPPPPLYLHDEQALNPKCYRRKGIAIPWEKPCLFWSYVAKKILLSGANYRD